MSNPRQQNMNKDNKREESKSPAELAAEQAARALKGNDIEVVEEEIAPTSPRRDVLKTVEMPKSALVQDVKEEPKGLEVFDVLMHQQSHAVRAASGQRMDINTLTKDLSSSSAKAIVTDFYNYAEKNTDPTKHVTLEVGLSNHKEMFANIRRLFVTSDEGDFQQAYPKVISLFKEYGDWALADDRVKLFYEFWTENEEERYFFRNMISLLCIAAEDNGYNKIRKEVNIKALLDPCPPETVTRLTNFYNL